MKYIYAALGWIIGLVFLLAGIASFLTSIYGALLFLAISALILPPVRKAVHAKTNRKLPTRIRGLFVVVLFLAAGLAISQSEAGRESDLAAKSAREKLESEARILKEKEEFFIANKDSILVALESAMAAGDYQSILAESRKYLSAESEELAAIAQQAGKRQNDLDRAERTAALLAKLRGIPAIQYERNLELYAELVKLNPGSSAYEEKAAFYSKKTEEAQAERAAVEAKRKQEQSKALREQQIALGRKENIESQFSSWNGAHRNLEKLIKQSMNDPKSFEHVETVYWDRGDHLVVRTAFRGKNAFGGVVKNTIKAKVSLSGNVLEVLEQY